MEPLTRFYMNHSDHKIPARGIDRERGKKKAHSKTESTDLAYILYPVQMPHYGILLYH